MPFGTKFINSIWDLSGRRSVWAVVKFLQSLISGRARCPKYTKSLAICLVVAFGCSCKGPASEQAPTRPALTVEVVSPSVETWPDILVASGEVVPWQEASIGAEVGGVRLDDVLVNVGDTVKKGQLLAQYNEDSLLTVLAQADAAVAESEANAAKADTDAKRTEQLWKSGMISQQELATSRTKAKVAEAQLAAAKAQRDEQALKVRYARVVSPDDGVISSRSATVGSVSTVGVELFRIVRRNRLEWHAEVPADSFAHLKRGLAATVQTSDGLKINGVLRHLSPTIDTNTRNGLAYVDLPAGSGLAAGMYVTGHFVLAARKAVSIPESAIVLRDGNRYLIKVDAQDHAHEIKVTTGRRMNDAIEILSQIDLSARFVKSGGAFVTDGDVVHIAPAGPAAR